jgi:hypothetical protein
MMVSFSGCFLDTFLFSATCITYGNCREPTVNDTTGPGAPLLLSATPGDGQVTLRWEASKDTDVTSHIVERQDPGSGLFNVVHAGLARDATSVVDRGLANARTYRYRVHAVDDNGNHGAPSNVLEATPQQSTATVAGRTQILEWGRAGSDPGAWAIPDAIATNRFGEVYVLDIGTSGFPPRVHRFGPTGTFIGRWGVQGTDGGNFSAPTDIATDAEGNVYVTDGDARMGDKEEVMKFDREGNFLFSWRQAGPSPSNGFQSYPRTVTVDAGGDVIVGEGGRILRYRSNGQFVAAWGQSGSSEPHELDVVDVATSPEGSVYTINEGQEIIQEFSPTGQFVRSWGGSGTGAGQFRGLAQLAVLPGGNIVAPEDHNNRVQEFDPTGRPIAMWGHEGAGEGQFDRPTGIATDCRGRIYVVDNNNRRVVVYGVPGSEPPPCQAGRIVPGPAAPAAAAPASSFRATFTTTAERGGPPAQRGTRLSAKAIVARGRYRGRLAGGRRAPMALRSFGGGAWRSRLTATFDLRTGKGTARGYAVATARRGRGRVCLKFTTRLTKGPRKIELKGTFRSAGGTGAGARVVANGRFTPSYRANGSFTISGKGRARDGPPRKMAAACRRLVR